jgi:hypothetical protein
MKIRIILRSIPGIAGDGLKLMIQTGPRDTRAREPRICDHGHKAMVILILVISVAVVAVLSISLGRWLQRKGTAMEQHHGRDEPPPGP